MFCDGVVCPEGESILLKTISTGNTEGKVRKGWGIKDLMLEDVRQRKRRPEQMVVLCQVYEDLQRKFCCTDGRRQRCRER